MSDQRPSKGPTCNRRSFWYNVSKRFLFTSVNHLGGVMAERKKPTRRKSKQKGQEGRVTLRIRQELIEDLESLADSEELSLSAYIRQLLKHEVVAKNSQEREFEQFRESQRGLHIPKSEGLRRKLA